MKVDERIVTERRKIDSKALGFTYLGLWLLIAYRMFILKQTSAEYFDVFILTILLSSYLVISNISKGTFTSQYKTLPRGKQALKELVYMLVFIGVFSYITGVHDPLKLLLVTLMMLVIRLSPPVFAKLSDKITDRNMK